MTYASLTYHFEYPHVNQKGCFTFETVEAFQCSICGETSDDDSPCDCEEGNVGRDPIIAIKCPICALQWMYVSPYIPVERFVMHLDEEHFT